MKFTLKASNDGICYYFQVRADSIEQAQFYGTSIELWLKIHQWNPKVADSILFLPLKVEAGENPIKKKLGAKSIFDLTVLLLFGIVPPFNGTTKSTL